MRRAHKPRSSREPRPRNSIPPHRETVPASHDRGSLARALLPFYLALGHELATFPSLFLPPTLFLTFVKFLFCLYSIFNFFKFLFCFYPLLYLFKTFNLFLLSLYFFFTFILFLRSLYFLKTFIGFYYVFFYLFDFFSVLLPILRLRTFFNFLDFCSVFTFFLTFSSRVSEYIGALNVLFEALGGGGGYHFDLEGRP